MKVCCKLIGFDSEAEYEAAKVRKAIVARYDRVSDMYLGLFVAIDLLLGSPSHYVYNIEL